MKRTTLIISCIALLLLCSQCKDEKNHVLVSPDEGIKIELFTPYSTANNYGPVYFRVLYKRGAEYVKVLPKSPLGISRIDEQFDSLVFTGESNPKEINENYQMITGKCKSCENDGTEKLFSFKNKNNQPVDIVFRAYNDGVAFRYVFPNHSDSLLLITDEATAFVLPDSTSRWAQPYSFPYEDFYPHTQTGVSDKEGQQWGFPLLYKVNDSPTWVLISEADITEDNCATLLSNAEKLNTYKVTYPSARETFQQIGTKSSLPWKSPWHTLIIGGLSDIVESSLITDVSEPNRLKETDWIKPGPVSWIYWAHNRGSKDYQKVVEYVDLAIEMNWPYILIDWEWNSMSNGGDIVDAAKYANDQGIKPLMWYNSGVSWLDPEPVDRLVTPEAREKEFTWLNEIGVYGIKVDFFAGDQQDMMQYYIDILKDAARHKLMVNFHGATLPRGWARTYPNLMTTEGVYGAEWYNNRPTLTNKAAAHNAVLPFTRNVVGSMDYTPVTFTNSQHPHITSYGHELALSVVFESGFQHFADRPSGYYDLPQEAKTFLKNVPVAWDETKLIDGYPGEKVIIARQKNNSWYIGGLNGKDEAQSLNVNLDFLESGEYNLQLIKDGNDDKTFSFQTIKVKKGENIKVDCLPRGGFTGTLKKIK